MKTLKVLLIISIAALSGCLTSCVNSYTVDGSGRDWLGEPIQTLPRNRVTPNADIPLPSNLGGGSITVPIKIDNAK